MKNIIYESKLGNSIGEFVKEKRSMGFCYDTEERLLRNFDKFIVDNGFDDGQISMGLVLEYSKIRSTENKNYRNKRITAVRQFAFYLISMGIDAYLPITQGSSEKTTPYLMDDSELKVFFYIVDTNVPEKKQYFRYSMMYPVLFRLIYGCGLRISEACNLRCENINLPSGTLKILQSKGNKDRIVYLSEDLRELCSRYDSQINALIPHRKWFFPGRNTQSPLPITTADLKFKQFWYQMPNASQKGKTPTVHGLRHLFVVNTINKWIHRGKDVDSLLLYLAKYLGHTSPPETLYYYHQVVFSGSLTHNKDSIRERVIPEVVCYED